MIILSLLLFAVLAPNHSSHAFPKPFQRYSSIGGSATVTTRLRSSPSSSQPGASSTPVASPPAEKIPASRFVVQNRFSVRKGREAAFEKRWADRESRLGTLDGFRFFCMLRRIEDADAVREDDGDPNYVSCTVWEGAENFRAWKEGDAFKEAHGGGTVGGVLSMLAATARNTRGKPKACFWEGLLPEVVAGSPPPDGEGWRRVEADGEATLDADCFVAMNRFSVRPGMEGAFEGRFAARESVLKEYGGFRGFLLLRRDGGKVPGDGKPPDDGCTHSTFSVWNSRESFDAWMSDAKEKPPAPRKGEGSGGGKPPAIFERPPVPTFYEGILSLESSPGI